MIGSKYEVIDLCYIDEDKRKHGEKVKDCLVFLDPENYGIKIGDELEVKSCSAVGYEDEDIELLKNTYHIYYDIYHICNVGDELERRFLKRV